VHEVKAKWVDMKEQVKREKERQREEEEEEGYREGGCSQQ